MRFPATFESFPTLRGIVADRFCPGQGEGAACQEAEFGGNTLVDALFGRNPEDIAPVETE